MITSIPTNTYRHSNTCRHLLSNSYRHLQILIHSLDTILVLIIQFIRYISDICLQALTCVSSLSKCFLLLRQLQNFIIILFYSRRWAAARFYRYECSWIHSVKCSSYFIGNKRIFYLNIWSIYDVNNFSLLFIKR